MNGKISRLSQYGFQLDGEPQVDGKSVWHNISKYEKGLSLAGLKVGDEVSFEANSKGYLTKLTKVGSASESPTNTAESAGETTKADPYSTKNLPDGRDMRITRLAAASTAFAALQYLKAEGDSIDDLTRKAEVLAERVVTFALTGNFEEVPF